MCVCVCRGKKCWQTARSGDFSLPLSFSALSVYFQFQFSLPSLALCCVAFFLSLFYRKLAPKNANNRLPSRPPVEGLSRRDLSSDGIFAFQVESFWPAAAAKTTRRAKKKMNRKIERVRRKWVGQATQTVTGRQGGVAAAAIVAHHFWPTKSSAWRDCLQLDSTRLDSLRFHVEAVWLLLLISFITKLISMLAFCFFGFLAECVCVGVRAWRLLLLLLSLVWSILCANCLGCVRTSIIFWCLWTTHSSTNLGNSHRHTPRQHLHSYTLRQLPAKCLKIILGFFMCLW